MPVAGQDGQLAADPDSERFETPPTPLGRAGQALKRLVFGPPLDASAIAVERMRKLVALSVLSDALSSVAAGSTAMTGIEAISNAVPAFEPVEALRMLPGPAGDCA